MPRPITRKTKMDRRVTFRATDADISNLKVAALKKGLDCSGLIRSLLIKQGVIKAV